MNEYTITLSDQHGIHEISHDGPDMASAEKFAREWAAEIKWTETGRIKVGIACEDGGGDEFSIDDSTAQHRADAYDAVQRLLDPPIPVGIADYDELPAVVREVRR